MVSTIPDDTIVRSLGSLNKTFSDESDLNGINSLKGSQRSLRQRSLIIIDFLVYTFTHFLLKVKVPLKRFHMNGHTIGLHRETQKFRL